MVVAVGCREDKLALVAMALVRRDVGLDDPQVQSLMHQLRHECFGQISDDLHRQQAWDALLQRLRAEVAADPTMRPQRRTGLLDQLEQARTAAGDGGGADGRSLHAVEQLRARANLAEYRLGQRLRWPRAAPEPRWSRCGCASRSCAKPHMVGVSRGPVRASGTVWPALPRDPATRSVAFPPAVVHVGVQASFPAPQQPPVTEPAPIAAPALPVIPTDRRLAAPWTLP